MKRIFLLLLLSIQMLQLFAACPLRKRQQHIKHYHHCIIFRHAGNNFRQSALFTKKTDAEGNVIYIDENYDADGNITYRCIYTDDEDMYKTEYISDNSQSFNRYSYCLNNTQKYTDPSGDFFILSAVGGFLKGTFQFVTGNAKWSAPFAYAYKNAANSLKTTYGLFAKGKVGQIVSRFTWELPQTTIGYLYSQGRVIAGMADHVRYFDGATYVIHRRYKNNNGVTLGNFININSSEHVPEDNGKFAPYKDPLYMHEYGHYLQSQEYGWGYLFSVGVPSLISAWIVDNGKKINVRDTNNGNNHDVNKHLTRWYEVRAGQKAYEYFLNKYGSKTEWNFSDYPLYFDKP